MDNKHKTNQKVNFQEKRTRKIMDKLIPDLFEKCTITNTRWMPQLCSVDYQFTATTTSQKEISYDVEVKELSYNYNFFEDLGYCGIKCSKLALMKEFNENSANDKLIYFLILEDAIIIYDMKNIDMNKCPLYMWEQRKTQFDENSTIERIPSFKLPLSQATYIKYINKQKYDN